MIVLITEYDEDLKTQVVSHGVESDTMRNVVLQQLPLSCYKDKRWNEDAGEWYLEG